MEKYDVVKDWEGVDFDVLDIAITYTPDWNQTDLLIFRDVLKNLRDKQLKTFPRLERK